MKALSLPGYAILVILILFSGSSCNHAAKPGIKQEGAYIDLAQARAGIEAAIRQFSEDFRNKDSVALADHYAAGASFGSVKGRDNLVSAWGRMIRSANEDGTPNVIFTTNSLASDEEYVAELGSYRFTDKDGTIKSQGKYLVVWKQENGEWKLYRDIGL